LRNTFPLAACLALGACGGLSIEERVDVRRPEGFSFKQSACYSMESGESTATGGGSADFYHQSESDGQVLDVLVKSADEVLAMRRYDRAFARSGTTDEFSVITKGGEEYRLRYSGSWDCDARE
jgi:hypothetical protein